MLAIDKGQFLCGVIECSILVRFDDGQPLTYRAVQPSDYGTTTLFIKNYDGFAARMLKAQRVKVQAEFYQEGNQTFEFDVSKFDVKKYRPNEVK